MTLDSGLCRNDERLCAVNRASTQNYPYQQDIALPLRVLYTRQQAGPPAQPVTGLP